MNNEIISKPHQQDNGASIDERVKSATVGNYRTVLDDIKKLDSDIEKEIHVGKLATALGVKSSTLMKEIKDVIVAEETTLKAVFPGLVDLATDSRGKVGYLVKHDGTLGFACSWDGPEGESYVPPGREHLPFTLGNAKRIQEIYGRDEAPGKLYDDLIAYFKRFSYLEDETWPLIVLSTFLTHMQDHKDIRYVPVIYFYAVAERGKSRTAKSILSVAHRGIHLVDLKSANIFRFAENLKATMFFDCTDLWGSAEKSDCSDILLGRFEKGCRLARVQYPDRGAFADQVFYEVFGSTIVATNEPANPTFESRCLTITMPNKPAEYEDLTPDMGIELKERLTAWRARMMDESLPNVLKPEGINGRLWDITKPLFQLCDLVKPEVRKTMIQVLLEMVGQKAEDKKESLEGRLVAAIDSLADFDGGSEVEIEVSDIRDAVNRGKLERYYISPQKVGKRIKSLSLRTKNVRGYARLMINQRELDVLKEQYGLLEPAVVEDTPEEWTVIDDSDWDIPDEILAQMDADLASGESEESGRESLNGPLTQERIPRPWSRDQQDNKPIVQRG